MRGLMILFVSAAVIFSLSAQDAGKKLPIPDQAAQAKALALVLDIFKEDMDAAKDAEAKTRLANNLLQQGRESRDDAANRYVLFREARILAAKAGDANLTLRAVDEMTRGFDVNPHQLKAAALAEVAENVSTKEAGQAVVDLLLPAIAEAREADNYEAALALGKVAETAARRSKVLALVTAVQKQNEDIAAAQKGFAHLQSFIDRLAKNPKDGQANLELGKYYAFFKGRWEKALPLLAMGSDEALKNLSNRDIASPKESKDQLALADGWWELALKEKDSVQLQLQRRAMFWYEQAVAGVAGLNRTKALKRIENVSARLQGTGAPENLGGPVGELKKFDGHTDEVKSVALSSDGHYGLSGSLDQTVRVWDLVTGKEDKVLRGHNKQVWSVAFHPNNRQAFSVSWDATARLWDIRTGAEIRRYPHRLDVNGLAVSRDGNTFLTGSDDHNAYLWNTVGDEMKRYIGHTGFVYAVAFAPDGRHVASGGVDKTVRVFDQSSAAQVKVFEGSLNSVTNIAFTPDSRFILSSGDGVIHMWDMSTGKEAHKFEGHTGLVTAMSLSHDGRRLLTGGDDKTIRLWDVATGKELHKFQGHTETVTCVAFSSDGHRALSGSLDRTVRLWGLPPR
jgi:WD40 repeat protein